MRRLVVDLSDERPIFTLPDQVIDTIRDELPADWQVVVVDAPASGVGDGGPASSVAALEAVREAEVYMGYGVPPDLLRAGPGLRWVHSGAAGVRASLSTEMLERDVLFTNSAGIHAPPVAETVLAYLLHFARGLDMAAAAQAERRWCAEELGSADSPVRELGHSTVGIVGLGGIGGEVARRCTALGARVLASRRRAAPPAGSTGPEGPQLVTGPAALRRVLESSHYVVLTLPQTRETSGLIGAEQLDWMRNDAVLVNISRGGLVDEVALLEALRRRRIRGAALDVFRREPLPPDHPLWEAPNLLITPHTSAYTHRFWERETALIVDNIRRYIGGRPLRNVVDKQAGY